MDSSIKVIALYLPQFHPTKDNDEWWGKGFTEWTNVGKAKALFRNHYQPKVPADLGYYDLRIPEVRDQQAELAKEAGVYGFCYYHYWFGNSRQELEMPFQEVLRLGKPDFPFCLCWANESWHSKFWGTDGTIVKQCLIEQIYDDYNGQIEHFNHLLPAFKDQRYIKIDGKPLFMIYKPFDFPNIEGFISLWNSLAKENGLDGIHFVAHLFSDVNQNTIDTLISKGFNAVNTLGLQEAMRPSESIVKRLYRRLKSSVGMVSRIYDYRAIYKSFLHSVDSNNNVYPSIIPNWDHTPRSGKAGSVIINSTPSMFAKHIRQAFSLVASKPNDSKIVFLKSWNEWGEGNYIEPDLVYGKEYIMTLKAELDNYNNI